MNPSKFDQIVKARAQQRIDARVKQFRASISDAFRALHKDIPSSVSPFAHHSMSGDSATYLSEEKSKSTLRALFHKSGDPFPVMQLPKEFWDHEEAEVSKALLATMDEMQKALCAPTDSVPLAVPVE